MHVGKINGVYFGVTEKGEIFQTAHYSNFTRRLHDELEKSAFNTAAHKGETTEGRETTDAPRGAREP